MSKKSGQFADAGAAAIAAIAAIEAEANAKKLDQLEGLNDAIAETRAAIRSLEKELEALVAVKERITGKAEAKATGRVSGGGKSTRMSAGEFETYKEMIIEFLRGKKEGAALSEIVAACGPKAPGVINKLKVQKVLKSNGIKGSSGRTMLA
jgi:uncharacterized coiled-coil protein SlyX